MVYTKAVSITFNNPAGTNPFHPNDITLSYLNLGYVPLIHTKTKTKKNILPRNQTIGGKMGPCQPPKNNVVVNALKNSR